MTRFTTVEQARAHLYGRANLGGGKRYVEGRCCEPVHGDSRFPSFHQCTRRNGHGPSGLYCKAHDPIAREAKQQASMREYRRQLDEAHRERARASLALEIAEDAVRAFNQEITFDELEKRVRQYEKLKKQ